MADPFSPPSEEYPPTYRYRSSHLDIVWQTSVPKDDEAALAYFHTLSRMGMQPVYCERVERPDGHETYTMLPEVFDPEKLETKPFGVDQL